MRKNNRWKIFVLLAVLGALSVRFTLLAPPDQAIRNKVTYIENYLKVKGYTLRYVVISGKRSGAYNKLLPLSSPHSMHLSGKAMDLWIIDADGDGKFTSADIRLLEFANAEVEKEHPDLKGAFGAYTRHAYPSNHMVHLDTRGYSVRYDK